MYDLRDWSWWFLLSFLQEGNYSIIAMEWPAVDAAGHTGW